jgi:hypothetical protein
MTSTSNSAKRDSSRFEAALLFAFAAHVAFFAALDFDGAEKSTHLEGVTSTPQPAVSTVAFPAMAAVAAPQVARVERAPLAARAAVHAVSANDPLGLNAAAARNPKLFGDRAPDRELESALAGVVAVERDVGVLAGIAPREMPAPRAESVLADSPATSERRFDRREMIGALAKSEIEKTDASLDTPRAGKTINAGIDMAGVRRAIAGRLHEARACYEQATDLDPGLFGVVRVEMTIGRGGRVENIAFGDATLEDASLARCLEARIKSWTFPSPTGARATVTYPLVFHRAG